MPSIFKSSFNFEHKSIQFSEKIVCNFPDEGYRYIDTVYDNNWIKENDVTFSEKSDVLKYIRMQARQEPKKYNQIN